MRPAKRLAPSLLRLLWRLRRFTPGFTKHSPIVRPSPLFGRLFRGRFFLGRRFFRVFRRGFFGKRRFFRRRRRLAFFSISRIGFRPGLRLLLRWPRSGIGGALHLAAVLQRAESGLTGGANLRLFPFIRFDEECSHRKGEENEYAERQKSEPALTHRVSVPRWERCNGPVPCAACPAGSGRSAPCRSNPVWSPELPARRRT